MSERRCRSQDKNNFSRSPNGFTVNKTTEWKCDNEPQKAETSPNNGQGYISIQYTCNDRDCQGNGTVCNGYTIAMDQLNQNQSSHNVQILPSGPFVGPLNCCEAVTPRPTCQQWGGNFQKLKDKWSTVTKYNVANQNCMGQPTGCQLYEIETSKPPAPGELQIVLPGCPTPLPSPKECCCCQLPPACACAQDPCSYSCAPCCPAQEDPGYCCLPKKSRQTVTIQVVLPKAKVETSESSSKTSVAVKKTGTKNAKSHQNVKVRSTTRTTNDPRNTTRNEYNFSTRNAPDTLHATASNESINNPYFASAPVKTKKTTCTGRSRASSKKKKREIVSKGKAQLLNASPPVENDDSYYESNQSQREGSSLYPVSHSQREGSSLYPRSRREESSSRRSQIQSEESSYPGSQSQREEDPSFLTGQSGREASSYSRSHITSEGSSFPRSERESHSRNQRDAMYDKNLSNLSSAKYGNESSRASKNTKIPESNKYFEIISDDGSTDYVLKRSNNKYTSSEPQYSNNNQNFYMDHNLQAGNPFMDQENSVMSKGRKRIKSRDKSKQRGKSHLNELMNEPPTTKSLKQIETMNHQGQVQQSAYSVPNTQTLYNPFTYYSGNNNNISSNNDSNGKKIQFLYNHKNSSYDQLAPNSYQVSQQYQGPHGSYTESEVFGADTTNTSPKSFNQLQMANPFTEKHAIDGDDDESIVWNPWFILLVGLFIIFVIFVIACFCLSPKKRVPRCMCNKPFPFC